MTKPQWATAQQTAQTSNQAAVDQASGKLMLAIDDFADTPGVTSAGVIAHLDGLATITSDPAVRQQFQQFLGNTQPQAAPAGALGAATPAPAASGTPTSVDATRLKDLEDLIGDIAGELGAVLSLNGGQIVIANAKTAIVDKITALKQAGTSTDVANFKATTVKPAIEALESALGNGNTGIGGVQKFPKDDWTKVEQALTAAKALKS